MHCRLKGWKWMRDKSFRTGSLKGTVSVISIDYLCKDGICWFKTIPFKPLTCLFLGLKVFNSSRGGFGGGALEHMFPPWASGGTMFPRKIREKKIWRFRLVIVVSYSIDLIDYFNKSNLWPNLKNLSGGLNVSRGLNMVGSTIKRFKI